MVFERHPSGATLCPRLENREFVGVAGVAVVAGVAGVAEEGRVANAGPAVRTRPYRAIAASTSGRHFVGVFRISNTCFSVSGRMALERVLEADIVY
jgi:hypothetical protein